MHQNHTVLLSKVKLRQVIISTLFMRYIIMVIGVTFLNRRSGIYGNVNFHFISTYIEAWNSFNQRNWQFIILNILLFVPLGIFLPIIHKKFNNILWTLFVGLIITLIIECLQYLTGFGIFDIDDIFNNILGTAIGYIIKMSATEMLRKQKNNRLSIFHQMQEVMSGLWIWKVEMILWSMEFSLVHITAMAILSIYRII